jgi:hypothetical protein
MMYMRLSVLISIIFALFVPVGIYVIYNSYLRDVSVTDSGNSTVLPTDKDIRLPTTNGNIKVDNFINEPDVVQDTYNTNEYFLGNDLTNTDQPGASLNYVVTFDATTKYFNIALLKKPLSNSRSEMESYLKNKLNISENDMCALNYSVTVPGYVDQQASGIDYRFSFCAGALKL